VLEKFGAMAVGAALLCVVLWVSIPLTGPPFELTPSLWDLAAACVMSFLLAIVFGSIALAVGCATGRRGLAIGVTAGFAGAAYLADLLTPAIESIEWLQYLSPFHYYLDPEPMMRGLGLFGSAVLAGISVVALAYALFAFERRDLAA